MMFSGEKTNEPLGPPTWTTWVLTIPAAGIWLGGAAGADADGIAARVSEGTIASPACVVATATPSRADAMSDLENNMASSGMRSKRATGYY